MPALPLQTVRTYFLCIPARARLLGPTGLRAVAAQDTRKRAPPLSVDLCSQPARLQSYACRAHKGPDSNTSVSPGTDLSTATKHRHASFSDFLLTIPFGIVNAAAGIVTLFLKGGWISVWMIISGFVLFTCGSMSQQNAGEGAESSWTLTVLPAIASAAMARNFYLKAIAGVTGTMIMTIASALVSLSLVYNIAAGGNKPRSEASSNSPSLGASISSQRLGAASSRPTTPTALIQDSTAEGSSMQEAAAGQSDSGMSVSGANVDTVVAVTGAVLYAQGLWGLWGETIGYSPAGMAAAAASGLAILGAARVLLPATRRTQAQ